MFDYNQLGCQLLLAYENPTRQEMQDFHDREWHFALFVKYSSIFLLFKFGNQPWQDAPYSYWLVWPDYCPDPEEDLEAPENRLLLNCFMINAPTGILEGMRSMSFSLDFTTTFLEAVREQVKRPISRADSEEDVRLVYRQYPTPRSMVKDAVAKCRGGD